VVNKRGKFCVKLFLHYIDIAIFALVYFILPHPVHSPSSQITSAPDSALSPRCFKVTLSCEAVAKSKQLVAVHLHLHCQPFYRRIICNDVYIMM